MSELSRRVSLQLLAEAEERFLEEHDWVKVREATAVDADRGNESFWTYRGKFKPRRQSNWTDIDRSHAVHAAKLVIRQQRRKNPNDPDFNRDDREH